MQEAFAAATSWTMAHPWGPVHPYVIATNEDGSRTFIVGPEFSDGQVVVTFGRPTAGVLELLNPTGTGSADLVDDLVSSATAERREFAALGFAATATTASLSATPGDTAAVIEPGQGAVIQ